MPTNTSTSRSATRRDRVPGAGGLPVPRQRHVDGLVDQHPLVAVGLQLGLAVGQRRPDRGAGRADALARLGPRGRRQRADLGVGQGDAAPGRRRGPAAPPSAHPAWRPRRWPPAPRRSRAATSSGASAATSTGSYVLFGADIAVALLRSAQCHVVNRHSKACRNGSPALTASPGRPAPDGSGQEAAPASRPRPPAQPSGPPAQPKSGVPAGMVNRNSAPPPGAWCTAIVPPCASTRPFTMNRPEARAAAPLGPPELAEHPGGELGRDARPLVADRYRDPGGTRHRSLAPPR